MSEGWHAPSSCPCPSYPPPPLHAVSLLFSFLPLARGWGGRRGPAKGWRMDSGSAQRRSLGPALQPHPSPAAQPPPSYPRKQKPSGHAACAGFWGGALSAGLLGPLGQPSCPQLPPVPSLTLLPAMSMPQPLRATQGHFSLLCCPGTRHLHILPLAPASLTVGGSLTLTLNSHVSPKHRRLPRSIPLPNLPAAAPTQAQNLPTGALPRPPCWDLSLPLSVTPPCCPHGLPKKVRASQPG